MKNGKSITIENVESPNFREFMETVTQTTGEGYVIFPKVAIKHNDISFIQEEVK
jgi:hypothetical protein